MKTLKIALFIVFLLIINNLRAQELPADSEFTIDEAISVFSLQSSGYGSKLAYEPATQSFSIFAEVILDSDINSTQMIVCKGNAKEDEPGWT